MIEIKIHPEEDEEYNGGKRVMKMRSSSGYSQRTFWRCSKEQRRNSPCTGSGFTILEILIVLVVLGIAAMMAVPMMNSAGSVQIQSAANMIAADLEYAKSISISTQQNHSVVFDTANNSYEVHDSGGAVIAHPVNEGFEYVVNFSADSRLNRVSIDTANFDPGSSDTVTFDYLGSPYSGTGTANPLNDGEIRIQADGLSTTIDIEPVTGFISIN